MAPLSTQRLRRIFRRLSSAARQYEASRLTLLGRMVWLRASRGLGLDEALFMGVLDPRVPARQAVEVVGRRDFVRVLRQFNRSGKELVDDKAIFYPHCVGCGLPTPPVIAFVNPPLGVTAAGRLLSTESEWRAFISEELPAVFVVKPVDGTEGRLVEIWERSGDHFLSAGRLLDAEHLWRRLCLEATYGRAIVQRRLKNHPALAALSGTDALQCTRIVTVITRAGKVEILYAFQKLIAAGNYVDDFVGAEGNMLTCIDLAAGKLGTAFIMSRELPGYTTCEAHPVTGRQLLGFELPHWEEACALVRHAATRFLPLRAIGWDVALTSEGPVLVEGNTEWVSFGASGFWYTEDDLARLQRML
jgi:Sugar-transfer associated ATP-grasp